MLIVEIKQILTKSQELAFTLHCRYGQTRPHIIMRCCHTTHCHSLVLRAHMPCTDLHEPSTLQAVEKLKLDTETPAAGVRPKGLGMVSCVGTEYVSFKSPLPLDNKVKSTGLSSNQRVTLQQCHLRVAGRTYHQHVRLHHNAVVSGCIDLTLAACSHSCCLPCRLRST